LRAFHLTYIRKHYEEHDSGLLAKSHLTNMLRLLITTHIQVKPKRETRLMKIISEYELYMLASLDDCLFAKYSDNASSELVRIPRTNARTSIVQGE
jgi:hypothetical protein